MRVRRVVIGIRYNRKALSMMDKLGTLCEEFFFSNVDGRQGKEELPKVRIEAKNDIDKTLIFFSEDETKQLIITNEQIIYSLYAPDENSSTNIAEAEKDLVHYLSIIADRLKIPPIRRIGAVAEIYYPVGSNNAGNILGQLFTAREFIDSNHANKANVRFETTSVLPPFQDKSYDQTIYSFYNSETDERPIDNGIMFNLDKQKYYAPAIEPKKIRGELKKLLNDYRQEKERFKKEIASRLEKQEKVE